MYMYLLHYCQLPHQAVVEGLLSVVSWEMVLHSLHKVVIHIHMYYALPVIIHYITFYIPSSNLQILK